MRELTLKLDMKPCSLNNSHKPIKKKGRYSSIKKDSTKGYEEEFTYSVLERNHEITKFAYQFRDSLHYLIVDYFFFFPRKQIITTKKSITKRRWDRCNITKIPNDCLSKILDIDDAVICDGVIKKLLSPDNKFHQVIKIRYGLISDLVKESKDLSRKFLGTDTWPHSENL